MIYPASCLAEFFDAPFKLSYIWTSATVPHEYLPD